MGKSIVRNTLYQIVARLVSAFIGFLITILIASNFGVTGFGDFTKVTAFVAIFYLFVDFGLNAIFLQNENNKFKDIFTARIIFSIFIFIICNLIVLVLPYSKGETGFSNYLKLGIFVFSFSIFFQSVIYSANAYFQKQRNYFYFMTATVIGALAMLAAVFIFTFLKYSIIYLFISLLFGSFITSATLLFFVKEKIFDLNLNIPLYKKMFKDSLPLGIMLIFNFIYFRIDILLLSTLSSTQAVGVYGLSYKFFDFLIALPLFLSNSIYPILLIARKEKHDLNKLLTKFSFVFIGSSIAIMIPFWFMSPLFYFIKPEFLLSVVPFRILLLSLPFFFLTSFLQWFLITIKKQKYLMNVYFLSTALNIFLNILFIPKFSYIASAFITVFSEGLVLVLLILKIYFERKHFYDEN